MSKVGKAPIEIPEEVKVTIEKNRVSASDKSGLEFSQEFDPNFVSIEINGDEIQVTRNADRKEYRQQHGLYRSLIANMINGLVKPFEKNLVIEGLGYRVHKQGNTLVFDLGYSHPIEYELPENIDSEVQGDDQVKIIGPDKQQVGQVAADIRSLRPPEPYKGKGIRYKGEEIIRKEGKLSGGEEAGIG